jgi:hypothetical protein
MSRVVALSLMSVAWAALLALVGGAGPARPAPAGPPSVRFLAVDVFLDSGGRALAAYQVQLETVAGEVKVVGIEGGEPAPFREAPYYDPAAMMGDRVIIGDFSTLRRDHLPSGRDAPSFDTRLHTAATAGGRPIPVDVISQLRDRP